MRRSGAASRRAQCVRLPLRGQHRLARLRCRQAPCFPFNCARRRARASTETRASVGGAGGSVKANRGAGCGRHVPVARSRRSRPASSKRPVRMRLRRRAVLSYAPRSVPAPALRQAQLNGKQEADIRPACAVPATVRRPRDALSARAPMPPTMPLPACFGWEGRGLASGQPGYRPTQGASDALAERPVRGGRTACAFCVLMAR